MAKFEEEKVITALHPEKAEVGKKYWFADNILVLKSAVEENNKDIYLGTLESIIDIKCCAIYKKSDSFWEFIYPYEEPPKNRMTNEQLAEWLAKGNGLLLVDNDVCYTYYEIRKENLESESTENFLIRPFGQTNWIEPTVDIYERDCKGGKQ